MSDHLTWIDRIIEVTGWRHEPEGGAGWEQVEAELGVALPTDSLSAVRARVVQRLPASAAADRRARVTAAASDVGLCRGESFARVYAPYGIYGPDKGSGLIQWGDDQVEGQYYWLADRSVEPERWPVVAQKFGGDPWHRFDMSMSEFIYRMIADPEFEPFTVASPSRRAFYLPYGQTISGPEEWDALTSPN